MPIPGETKRALIVVKTYPAPAWQGVEVSCTAAITDKGKWLRLFPVPYRLLAQEQRFKRYQWIDVNVEKASDPRPESHRLIADSIKFIDEPLDTRNGWRARKEVIFPLKSPSLCALQALRDTQGYPTLGIIKPRKIDRLVIKPTTAAWNADQLAALRQGMLFEKPPTVELEKIPYEFKYEFTCEDTRCTGHSMICTDWEMGQAYRDWKRKYGRDWESKFRLRFEEEMINKFDTHFYMGTIHKHPGSWIVVGLFYPPKAAPG